ncbi:MAG: hypothetical protein HYS27_27190 [Deltaproteobacteria bacterium]|nr:hypothetical protein [Deltaproteobacteria bacterium]
MPEPVAVERARARDRGLPLGLAAAVLAAGLFAWLLLRAQTLPEGPAPVVWDKTACAHCRMHVGEPGFAAQLQLEDGTVHNFDDPGCLARWLDEHPKDAAADAVHAIFFHHKTDDRWLTRAEVGFVDASPTPMGFGLAAVDARTPGAVGWQQAMARTRGPHAAAGAP